MIPKYLNFATFSKDLLAISDFILHFGDEKKPYT
jgi:hypothetical protein